MILGNPVTNTKAFGAKGRDTSLTVFLWLIRARMIPTHLVLHKHQYSTLVFRNLRQEK